MRVSERTECGYVFITREDCNSRGCCYDESVNGAHWCFLPTSKCDSDQFYFQYEKDVPWFIPFHVMGPGGGRGTPTWSSQGVPRWGGILPQVPPSNLAGGTPMEGVPTSGTPTLDLAGGTQWEGTPPWVCEVLWLYQW